MNVLVHFHRNLPFPLASNKLLVVHHLWACFNHYRHLLWVWLVQDSGSSYLHLLKPITYLNMNKIMC